MEVSDPGQRRICGQGSNLLPTLQSRRLKWAVGLQAAARPLVRTDRNLAKTDLGTPLLHGIDVDFRGTASQFEILELRRRPSRLAC